MTEVTSHCPATKAADLLGDKWTLLILRAMVLGATRYSEFSSAIPRISPSVLSGRLKSMCDNGLVIKRGGAGQQATYRLTPSGRECEPLIAMLAVWGLKWAERHTCVDQLDVGASMWDIHKTLNTDELPDGETVLHFSLTDLDEHNRWWIAASRRDLDLCDADPGKEVDLYVRADLQTLIDVWMGERPLEEALAEEDITMTGERPIAESIRRWFPISPVARARNDGINPAAMPLPEEA